MTDFQACMNWLSTNTSAIQAGSAIIMAIVTSWYAFRAHQLTAITNKQLKLLQRTQKPFLDVAVETAYIAMSDGSLFPALSLKASNTGVLPVTVEAPFIQLPDKRTLVFTGGYLYGDTEYPRRLEPGDGCSVCVDAKDILSIIEKEKYRKNIKIRGAYRDKPGSPYLSKPYIFESDIWRRYLQDQSCGGNPSIRMGNERLQRNQESA
jgi:hypothetical protein